MFNYALRYQPILDALNGARPSRVLDVGSGAQGLAMLWRGAPIVATDLHFKRRPLAPGAAASATALPFADGAFPAVVSCDTLEHIPPPLRRDAVREMARVAGGSLLLGFPSGAAAMRIYYALAHDLAPNLPTWLLEHLEHGLPDADEVASWLRADGWNVTVTWYESAEAHRRLVRQDMRLPVKLLSYALFRLAGPWLAPRLPLDNARPHLRVLIRAERGA